MQSPLFEVESFVTIGDSMGNLNECDNFKDTSFNKLIRAYNNLNMGLMLKVKWQWSNLEKKGPRLNLKLKCQTWFQP